MTGRGKRLRAIDLYSGVGGWGLGLRLAGIEVVASYELWGPANETNFKNNRHQAQTADIRRLSLDELPKNIDIVVGSPPCTQFSFSNRGGNGDIADGMKDIVKFLTIVDHLKPKAWAMENVPRVAQIIEKEMRPGGRLRRFRHLNVTPHVVNMEEFGLPQRRLRCLAGSFNFDLLKSYCAQTPERTLGEVVAALASNPAIDPIFGLTLAKENLRDHLVEDFLNAEEVRINRANKTGHPVYNSMPFPDRLDRSVRTITATCTRVSRESIVIEDPAKSKSFRRLTIRERASLQGFPITFQFYGSNYSQKLRMVGNAVPPVLTYYVAHAFRGTAPKKVPSFAQQAIKLRMPATLPSDARPDRAGAHYPTNRKFRFAISSLRLKSGVRFELVNAFKKHHQCWQVNFYFGSSKSIHSLSLDRALQKRILQRLPEPEKSALNIEIAALVETLDGVDVVRMQSIWNRTGLGRTTPFMLLDTLDEFGARLTKMIETNRPAAEALIAKVVEAEHGNARKKPVGISKLVRNAPLIVAGLLVGSVTNTVLSSNTVPPARKRA